MFRLFLSNIFWIIVFILGKFANEMKYFDGVKHLILLCGLIIIDFVNFLKCDFIMSLCI